MIIWLNGSFRAGKTTLAVELHRRIPGAVIFDPEQLGLVLWKWVPPNDDFQDLPSWRELVVATALALRRHHTDTLIVPMSLVRRPYQAEILGALDQAGEEVLHVFLEADVAVLRDRQDGRLDKPENEEASRRMRAWADERIAYAVAAAEHQPEGTVKLRSDRLTPAELGDAVLAAAGLG